uniref:Secreted protein n=1 Tax=Cyclopterus lumpus TaxID=8103 RepID=A0A8C2ZM49_CYCLU
MFKFLNTIFSLGGQFFGLCLLQLSDASRGFGAHDAASPAHLLISVIVVGLDGFHKLGKCTLILTRREQSHLLVLIILHGGVTRNY